MASLDDTPRGESGLPTDTTIEPVVSDPADSAPTDPADSAPTDPADSAPTDPADSAPTDPADSAPTEAAETPPRRTRKRAATTAGKTSRARRATRAAGDDAENALSDDGRPGGEPATELALPQVTTSEPAGDVDSALDAIDADAIDVPPTPIESPVRDEPAEPATVAPAPAFGFGLLFQAPDPEAAATALSRRRSRRPQSDAVPEPADDEATENARSDDLIDIDDDVDSDQPARGSRRRRERGDDDTGSDRPVADTQDDDDDDRPNRRRRRRGGKGRRRAGDEAGEDQNEDTSAPDAQSDTESDSSDTSDDAQSEGSPADSTADGDGGGRRRTRRRRRSGAGADGDDPPGTVTKVREPRPQRDEATGIKGSTRLEAKRQRRREGREAGRRRTIITEAEFLARRESVERVMVVRQHDAMTQIGVLEDGVLVEHYISSPGSTSHVAGSSMAGNVYLGRVQNVLPSMEAAFVDIGKGRNAVLYAGEVNWDAAGLEQHKARRIENALSSGQSVLVQVTKDPIGHKGARLTSQISLPGRYLVYVPDGSMTGISRKLPDTERARLKKILKEIVPDNAGVIVRTAAEGASEAELTADVERLTNEWERIQKRAASGNAPVLLHGEPDLTVRVVRDVFNEDFSSLVVSGDQAWATVSDYVHSVAPDLADRLTRWTGEKDAFREYRIDEQLAKAMDRKVWLPSGGSLVIDRTEAMTVIDVNTGKFTGAGGNLEETVTKNNIEAAEEIVRQLRLRDVGGIIVIDFIDMVLEANRDLVVRRLIECLGRDRTKHQVAEVTSLGLVQMTRKRVGAGLIEVFSEPCPSCDGRGLVIQSEPVDRSNAGSGAASAGSSNPSVTSSGSGETGRGRRGRKTKNGNESTGAAQAAPGNPSPSGPTPAQIAAAAYAAAVAGHRDDDAAPGADESPTDPSEVVAAIEAALPPSSDDSSAPESSSTSLEAANSGRDGDPAPVRRRGGRRAVRSAAGAPAAAHAVVIVAEPSSNIEVSAALTEAASSVQGDAVTATPTSDHAVVAEGDGPPSVPASDTAAGDSPEPRRRKRARVVAPAGPPSAPAPPASQD